MSEMETLKTAISKVEKEVMAWETERKNWNEVAAEREEQIKTLGKSDDELKDKQKSIEATLATQEANLTKSMDELGSRLGEVDSRLAEIDKRIGRSGNNGSIGGDVKTPGQILVESDAIKAFHNELQSGVKAKTPDVSVKTLRTRLGADSFLSDATATFVEPFRPGLLAQVERRLFFRDLVGTTTVGLTNSVTHIRELGFRSDSDVISVSSMTQTGGVATVNTASAHNLVPGNIFEIIGANQAEYNGVFTVQSVVDADSLTFDVDSGAVSPATGTITLTRLTASGAAAGTAEGSAMPQASTRWEEESVAIRIVGHWIAVSAILLDDLPQMASFIDRRLVYGIEFEIEEQGLYGSGAGQQFQGVFTHPRRLHLTKGSDTLPDAILRAIAFAYQAEYIPNSIWMNPMDYYYGDGTNDGFLNYKDTGNGFQFLQLAEAAPRAIDGIRIIPANSVRQGDLGVVDLSKACTLYDRQAGGLSVTNSHGTDFPANMLAIKAFERMGLGVHYGPAIVHMDLTT